MREINLLPSQRASAQDKQVHNNTHASIALLTARKRKGARVKDEETLHMNVHVTCSLALPEIVSKCAALSE
jgi:hypothetical protein